MIATARVLAASFVVCIALGACSERLEEDPSLDGGLQAPGDAGQQPSTDAGSGDADAGHTAPDAGNIPVEHDLPESFNEFASRFVHSACTFLVRCGGLGAITDVEFCETYYAPMLAGGPLGDIRASLIAGDAEFREDAASKCLAALESDAACDVDDPLRDVPECRAALDGKLPENGACRLDAACADGRVCFKNESSQCRGTCVEPNTRCNSSKDCAPGFLCDFDTLTCAAMSIPPGGDGEPCGDVSSCQDGFGCYGEGEDPDVTWVCRPWQGVGGACDANGGCGPGLRCHGSTMTCVVLPQVEGGDCQRFEGDHCAPGLVCTPESTLEGPATCLPQRTLGEPCTHLFQCGGFASRLICDIDGSGTCIERPKLGEPCPHGGLLGCDFMSAWCDTEMAVPTCKPFLPDGGDCDGADLKCGPGATCAYVDWEVGFQCRTIPAELPDCDDQGL